MTSIFESIIICLIIQPRLSDPVKSRILSRKSQARRSGGWAHRSFSPAFLDDPNLDRPEERRELQRACHQAIGDLLRVCLAEWVCEVVLEVGNNEHRINFPSLINFFEKDIGNSLLAADDLRDLQNVEFEV